MFIFTKEQGSAVLCVSENLPNIGWHLWITFSIWEHIQQMAPSTFGPKNLDVYLFVPALCVGTPLTQLELHQQIQLHRSHKSWRSFCTKASKHNLFSSPSWKQSKAFSGKGGVHFCKIKQAVYLQFLMPWVNYSRYYFLVLSSKGQHDSTPFSKLTNRNFLIHAKKY